MRRLLVGMVVAVATALAPLWAMAGNQEVAEKIAANLRESGQLRGYKIGVKFQDGTAWLRGQVANHEQMNSALKIVFQTPGVTRVENNLTIAGQEPKAEEIADEAPAKNTQRAFESRPRMVTNSEAGSRLQQASGAMAPEKLSRTTPTVNASALATTFRPAPVPQVNRVSLETAELESAPQPDQAMVAAPVAVAQSHPIPIAYTQPVPTPAPPAPTVMEPQAMPQPVLQPAPAMAPGMNGAPLPMGQAGAPIPQYVTPLGPAVAPPAYDQPHMPNHAWPSYAAYPNYAGLTYPKQYSPTAWPYIGPFYPYPQVPLGWRKVTLEWHDGWWNLDFDDGSSKGWFSGLFRPCKK